MIRKLVPGLLWASILSACGSDMVNITLLTPIPVANPTQNLSNTLIQRVGNSNAMVSTLAGPACRQMELRAGFKAPGWDSPFVPVALSTEILDYDNYALTNEAGGLASRPNAPAIGVISASTYLNTNSALSRPIVIPVPKGVEGELFLLGTVVEPVTKDQANAPMNSVDGQICRKLDSNLLALKTFAVYEQQSIKINESGTKSLRPNVIQTVRPWPTPNTGGSTPPLSIAPYFTPVPGPPLNHSNSDFKCRNLLNPRSCTNRHLFEMKLLSTITLQLWIRQPPPPEASLISTRLGVPSNDLDFTSFYLPKMSPFLMTYVSTGTFNVLVKYFQHEIEYVSGGGRVSQALRDCRSAGAGWVGNVPTSNGGLPPTTPVGCNFSSTPPEYNFAIKDMGEGFN